ncbi:2-hydroxychromene-2-carboxylate isomerase [Ruegeria aquimaris]|uniref:2-hydroxychromene-2-carboxylate isomerase n=1 Tax=Ruegeria aquimaris TaxID=2984333 RepID=A0ABT3AM34_9RHOB|nr:2-hydroxychromene-2-carboxylate isomerase [Ruegeria sp. XHP0148]MCV2889746.1 2-hydroxychromene-2-carboxylate isomerase [Ruegeria sp. XHP0148]
MARIDYFYSAHSAYAYLGAQELYRICATHPGTELVHRPILLSPVVEAAGGLTFAERSKAHVDYFFGREIERWAEWRGVPVIDHRPTYHDNPLDLPNGVIIAAQRAGLDVNALSFAILQAHWRDDADIADPGLLNHLIAGLGMEPEPLLTAARSEPALAEQAANTQEAIDRALFGSPSYVVDGDPFYGQDRLDLVARALMRPFRPGTWRNPPVG